MFISTIALALFTFSKLVNSLKLCLFATGCLSDSDCVVGTKCEKHQFWNQCVVDESVSEDGRNNCKMAKYCGALIIDEAFCSALTACSEFEKCTPSIDSPSFSFTSNLILTETQIPTSIPSQAFTVNPSST
jgi:hypothetical protein